MDKANTGERSAAAIFLDHLAAAGIEYIFGNAGTDFPPMIEALAHAASLGRPTPKPIVVPHENVAVAMAHGHTMISGRMQMVMVHVGLGTANALNGIFNAARLNVPMLLAAGRTPATEQGVFGGRNNYINWAQEMFDQAGMLRELVKWEYELRHPTQMRTALDRALAIAQSAPAGPVYLTLPREVFAASVTEGEGAGTMPLQVPHRTQAPDPDAIRTLAGWIRSAERPVIVTSAAGGDPAVWDALAALAERAAIPVVQYRPRTMALPTSHPMHAGYNSTPYVRNADLVIVLESDVPWIPSEVGEVKAKVAHVGQDPLFARYPYRGFRTDLAIAADAGAALRQLVEHLPADALDAARVAARRAEATRARQTPRTAFADGKAPSRMNARWVTACLDRAKDDDAILINEYPLVLEELDVARHGQYFSHSPAGGLGWAMGAALGAKLAAPERTVIAAVGDGAYMFGNPTPTHMVSRALGLPVLFVVCNNRRWGAVHRATLSMYPQGYAAAEAEPPFSCLEPSPDYERLVEASGGYGERVEDPAALPEAIARALRVVREEGRQAVLNVICDAVYERTS